MLYALEIIHSVTGMSNTLLSQCDVEQANIYICTLCQLDAMNMITQVTEIIINLEEKSGLFPISC